MRVFIAGATGVLGSRVTRALVDAGHDVSGTARSDAAVAAIEASGAQPVRVDLLDPAAVREAVDGHEAVINLTTSIPPMRDATKDAAWRDNHQLREQVSGNLVDAALATDVAVLVQESIVFPYPDRGEGWIDEDEAFTESPHTVPVRAAEAAVARFRAAGRVGTVLRFGMLYSADGEHTRGMATMARRGITPLVGARDAFVSFVHADDAAEAVVAALRAPAGVYNVVDAEPIRRADLDAVLGAALGCRSRLLRLPTALARFGGPYLEVLSRSQRVANARFRAAADWSPGTASPRDGWPRVVAELRATGALPPARPRGTAVVRSMLGVLAVTGAIVGVWAAFAPHAFYTSFPGAGRAWVALDGPFNEHLVRDVGNLNLALASATVLAAVWLTDRLVRVVAVAWLVFAVPHLAYHLGHLRGLEPVDLLGIVLSLTVAVLVPFAVLVLQARVARRPQPEPSARGSAAAMDTPEAVGAPER